MFSPTMNLRIIQSKAESFQPLLPRAVEWTTYSFHFTPNERRKASRHLIRRATDSKGHLELVKREDKGEDTVLFVFGTEAEKQKALSEREEEKRAQESQNAVNELPDTPVSSSTPQEGDVGSSTTSEAAQTFSSAEEEQGQGKTPSEHSAGKLEEMRVVDLREIAKKRGLQGYSKMKKDELISYLQEG